MRPRVIEFLAALVLVLTAFGIAVGLLIATYKAGC